MDAVRRGEVAKFAVDTYLWSAWKSMTAANAGEATRAVKKKVDESLTMIMAQENRGDLQTRLTQGVE